MFGQSVHGIVNPNLIHIMTERDHSIILDSLVKFFLPSQDACITYDEADHMTSLTTFRGTGEVIASDPQERGR